MEDSRGVTRGACSECTCVQYHPPDDAGRSLKCSACDHFPTKHQKLSARKVCRFRGCYQPIDFNLNTGEEKLYCIEHEGCQSQEYSPTNGDVEGVEGVGGTMQVQDIEYDGTVFTQYSGDETQVIPMPQHPPHDGQYLQG